MRGPVGAAGQTGATGAQGAAGATGARGASADGYAGPAGSAGVIGQQGATGATGERGPTLVGPAGSAGRPGQVGERGDVGQTGPAGRTTAGVAGATGLAGPSGPQGPTGATGPIGPAGIVEHWVAYRDFWFDRDMDAIHDADRHEVAEIAAYMKANPSLLLGIDGSANSSAVDARGIDLGNRRVNAIRNALVQADVPFDRIVVGTFGDQSLRLDQKVEVFLRTSQSVVPQVALNGVGETWVTYRDCWFDDGSAIMQRDDMAKVTEIAAHMKANPSLVLGIDGSTNPRATDSRDIDLNTRRIAAVRSALITAGVPSERIATGMLGDIELRRDGRVEVLLSTKRLAQAR